MKADFHLHTHHSDGTDSPATVVGRAAKMHFDMVAVTDHDTLSGVPEALEAGRQLGVNVIPGAEITAQFHHQELHLLAYFPSDETNKECWRNAELASELEKFASHRAVRAEQIVKKLNSAGIPLTMADVQEAVSRFEKDPTPRKSAAIIGRPHVAAALLAKGHVSSIDCAFDQYLKRGRPCWVDKERAAAADVINLVHRAGGICLLAHPGLLRDDAIPRQLLENGIDGVEAYHSRHTSHQSHRFRNWAHQHRLIVSGGSDCHGDLKGEPLMGRVEFSGQDLDAFLARLNKAGTPAPTPGAPAA